MGEHQSGKKSLHWHEPHLVKNYLKTFVVRYSARRYSLLEIFCGILFDFVKKWRCREVTIRSSFGFSWYFDSKMLRICIFEVIALYPSDHRGYRLNILITPLYTVWNRNCEIWLLSLSHKVSPLIIPWYRRKRCHEIQMDRLRVLDILNLTQVG